MDFYIKWLGVSSNSAVLATGLCVGQKWKRFAHEVSLHTLSPALLFNKQISKSLCLNTENEVRLFLLTSLSSWFTRNGRVHDSVSIHKYHEVLNCKKKIAKNKN